MKKAISKMKPPEIRTAGPTSALLGINALYRIRNDPLAYYQSLNSTFGDTVKIRLGPYRCWFIFHPDHIESVLATKASSFIRFEKIMNILRQWNGNSLLIAEGSSWKNRRRKVLPSLSQQRIPSYAKLVSRLAQDLTETIISKIKENGSYESSIDDEMAQYSLEVAYKTLFNKNLNTVVQPISEAVNCLSEIAYKETTSAFTLPRFIPTPANRKKKKIIKLMRSCIRDIVLERIEQSSKEESDLLSILIKHHGGNTSAIEEDVISLLIAGHETSGATLSWLFLLLAKHQDVQHKIQKELDNILGNTSASYENLKNLPYLNAVIKETMRLYPSAYALFCRRATEDVDIGGALVKKGDLVQIFPYITQRDNRWFKDADRFNPERFINSESWPKYAYFPFGAGPRICIGQSFGMMEVALTIATILQRLSLSQVESSLESAPRFSLRPDKNITISFSSRPQIERVEDQIT
ncbi:cytochrome P450 [Microbulbifer epialgicus]|uniref:Cytochrome P450 n=1 Tax=Microbulbifer epialgicus TaxID=393907 RepID=A0ABV4P444_9GAMM